ncbi:hypothetical protein BSL78_19819 [Apostichopus japonicus]|uniref:PDZ domain-containing protein n=1 Tax=Stichopus japonicus TaxID=307972 RepID=A0A2G8K5M2_STIJA|nr:hypothetical protein BSL78_19819 [Apostichopus japonicus]
MASMQVLPIVHIRELSAWNPSTGNTTQSDQSSANGWDGDTNDQRVPRKEQLTVRPRSRSRSRSPLRGIKSIFFKKDSVQEPPGNNVNLSHPSTKSPIRFGLHIKVSEDGCFYVARAIENGLASLSTLQQGDVISKLNGTALKGYTLADVSTMFYNIDVRKEITMVILREKEEENGNKLVVQIEVTITLILSVTKIQVYNKPEVHLTATIQSITKVPQMDGNRVSMDTTIDSKSKFRMELYETGSKSQYRVCVIRNEQCSNKVLDGAGNVIHAEAFDKPSQGETTKYPDAKFFYWYAHPEFVGDDVFESFTNKNYFMTVGSNNSLGIEYFRSAALVEPRGRFRVNNV